MVLEEPLQHPIIPSDAKWLAGEGAGSWFYFVQQGDLFNITRFSPEGNIECSGLFKASRRIRLKDPFEISYPSHCQIISIIQQGERITFKRFSD